MLNRTGVHFDRKTEFSGFNATTAGRPRFGGMGYRSILQDNSIQLLPPLSRRSFKWSFWLARTLRRLNPANYL